MTSLTFEADDGAKQIKWARLGLDSQHEIGRPIEIKYVLHRLKKTDRNLNKTVGDFPDAASESA